MKTYSKDELNKILELHTIWANGDSGGERADLSRTNLSRTNLSGVDLRGADLEGANLRGANLSGAYLEGAYLEGADLEGANLSDANLEPIKKDFFKILSQAVNEISFLEKAILEGKIDGSTYEGECACLCGTIEKAGNKSVGRYHLRPIEIFFLSIKKGDTPENNQFSKIAMGWLQEFKISIGESL